MIYVSATEFQARNSEGNESVWVASSPLRCPIFTQIETLGLPKDYCLGVAPLLHGGRVLGVCLPQLF